MPTVETIKFACGNCAHPIEATVDMRSAEVACPSCGKRLTVWQTYSPSEFKAFNERKKASQAAPPETSKERENLRGAADGFMLVSGILMVFAMVAVLWFFFVTDNRSSFIPLYMAGAAVALALWSFLIAQLIHIRAALAKSRD